MMDSMKRKKIMCGPLAIGGGAPITIQSMVNKKDSADIIEQIHRLEDAGCDIVRLSIPNEKAARDLILIKKKTQMPIVADIHFDYKLAIMAIENGADKIRINPGNIGGHDRVRAVVDSAKSANIPIRVGVNAGSLEKDLLKEMGYGSRALAESALRNVRLLESFDFEDIVVSMKASDIKITYDAHKILASQLDYPFHIGITESGTVKGGKIKSSIGIGALLLEGIGDTIRVSLTGDPVQEIVLAKEILNALGLRSGGFEVISCPTCARCGVDLEKVANEVEARLSAIENKGQKIRVAIMGCAVNGPGEARAADVGIACGVNEGLLFYKGQILEKVAEEDMINKLISLIKTI